MPAPASQFVGRDSELEQLKRLFNDFAAAPATKTGLEIVSISGCGGVGKTYLLETALSDAREALKETLVLKVDATNENALKDFALIVDQMLAPRELPPPAQPKKEYFPQTRGLLSRQMELIGLVEVEISGNKQLSEQIKTAAKALYRLSPAIKYIPKVGPAVAATLKGMESLKAEEYVEPALNALDSLQALKDETGFFTNHLRKWRLSTLRHSPFEAVADALVADLNKALFVPAPDGFTLFDQGNIAGLNRLVLLVDDYEAVGRVIGTFLVQSLLPKLKNASFHTLAVVLGRDNVYDADKDFAHHLAGNITALIKLEPFSKEEGVKYLKGVGYADHEASEWYEKSRGLPFILRLLAENRTDAEKQNALFYKRFYERTTRWMAPEERKWLTPISYLDQVNEGTIKALLPAEDPKAIMNWFEGEASVRDVHSPVFTVTHYIRHMLLEYNRRKVGDAEHERLIKQAQKAMEEA